MPGMSEVKNKKERKGETCLIKSASNYNFIGIGVLVGL